MPHGTVGYGRFSVLMRNFHILQHVLRRYKYSICSKLHSIIVFIKSKLKSFLKIIIHTLLYNPETNSFAFHRKTILHVLARFWNYQLKVSKQIVIIIIQLYICSRSIFSRYRNGCMVIFLKILIIIIYLVLRLLALLIV